jgi:segregation and condensation protein B
VEFGWKLEGNNSELEKDNITEEELALVEAALYVTGRPLGLGTLGSLLGTRSKSRLLRIAQRLVERYNSYNCALEVLEVKKQRFVMQLRAEYAPRAKKVSLRPILTSGPLRTLSYVAYHQPVLQTKVIESRGSHAYRHLKLLEEQNLITRNGAGRTSLIRTTNLFADYFGLSHDPRALKRQIKSIFKLE